RFVGWAPLGAYGYDQLLASRDSTFNPATGLAIRSVIYQPSLTPIDLPRADGVSLDVEHRVSPHLELQAGVRQRLGSSLPTVVVPEHGGLTPLVSNGSTTY